MEVFDLFIKTILLRPYVFLFLAAFLFSAIQLIGWPRTWRFWLISWATAFVCEFSSTRTGIPFGWYFYNGSTVGQELYFFDVPFMDSISFSFLLFASYCVALGLLLPLPSSPTDASFPLRQLNFDLSMRTSWGVYALTTFLFAFVDMVIDPVALRGDRWFFDYAEGDTDDEPIHKLGQHKFATGEYVSVADEDGRMLTYKVTDIQPVD